MTVKTQVGQLLFSHFLVLCGAEEWVELQKLERSTNSIRTGTHDF